MSADPRDAILAHTVPSRSSSMAWQTLDGEMVLLNIRGKEMMGLNPVGGRIWSLIDGTRSIAQIAETVTAEFEVAGEAAAADVKEFVAELARLGALEVKS